MSDKIARIGLCVGAVVLGLLLLVVFQMQAALLAAVGDYDPAEISAQAWSDYELPLRDQLAILIASTEEDGTEIPAKPVKIGASDDITVTLDGEAVVLGAGEAHAGEVHLNSAQVDVTPTISTAIYAAGDVIGGIQTITNAARVSGSCTTLDTLVITDLSMQDADLKVWFFNQNPSNGTYTDNVALDIHDTDLGFCIGWVEILSSDYIDGTDNSVATRSGMGLKLTPSGSANLYAIVEIEDADTYAGASDLVFKYSWCRD